MSYYTYISAIVIEHLRKKNKNVNTADLKNLKSLNYLP
jgi:hypothetical protein